MDLMLPNLLTDAQAKELSNNLMSLPFGRRYYMGPHLGRVTSCLLLGDAAGAASWIELDIGGVGSVDPTSLVIRGLLEGTIEVTCVEYAKYEDLMQGLNGDRI